MSSTPSLSVTHPQLRDNRTSGSAFSQKGPKCWNQYTGSVLCIDSHSKKNPKKQPAGREVGMGSECRALDISWHLLAPHRVRIIICGPPSKSGSWFRSTLVLFPVTVPRAAFNLWEVIWIDMMFSRGKGVSGQFYPNIAKEVSSG